MLVIPGAGWFFCPEKIQVQMEHSGLISMGMAERKRRKRKDRQTEELPQESISELQPFRKEIPSKGKIWVENILENYWKLLKSSTVFFIIKSIVKTQLMGTKSIFLNVQKFAEISPKTLKFKA